MSFTNKYIIYRIGNSSGFLYYKINSIYPIQESSYVAAHLSCFHWKKKNLEELKYELKQINVDIHKIVIVPLNKFKKLAKKESYSF